ncbi:unnamed protein product [Alopecurus aequalis]
MTVVKAETPTSALMRVALAASDTPMYLHHVLLWVAAAACIAAVIGRRALGEVEGAPMASAAFSVAFYSAAAGVLLFPVAMVLLGARILRAESNDTHAEKDIKEPPKTTRQIVWKVLKDPFMIGNLICMPFFMLIGASLLLEGSRMEQIGSIFMDVGILGSAAAHCIIVLPTQMLRQWRMK